MTRIVNPSQNQAQIFGRNMRRRRCALGIWRVELAAASGVSKSSIDNYECGRVQPSAWAIAQIARALSCTSDYLLGMED